MAVIRTVKNCSGERHTHTRTVDHFLDYIHTLITIKHSASLLSLPFGSDEIRILKTKTIAKFNA